MEDFRKQFTLSLLGYAAQRGISPQVLCSRAGISYKSLQHKSSPAPDESRMEQLWLQAILATHDPFFGLHLGESMQLAALGVMGQILQSSDTAGEALSHAGALLHLITDMFRMQISSNRQHLDIHLTYDKVRSEAYPNTFRQMAEYLMVFTLHELRGLVLQPVAPVSVQLAYTPTPQQEYSRVFACPVSRKNGSFMIRLPRSFGDEPILSASRELQRYLLQQISLFTQPAGDHSPLHTRIYNYLLTNSYLYTLSQEAVAANFNISPRSLQRKLKEEGITYLQIVEEVRKALALHYLKQDYYQIKDIASLLGYNEQSAFVRAFKRWTGQTPSDYRQG